MELNDIYNLIDKFENSKMSSMELEFEDVRLSVKKEMGVVYTERETANVERKISEPSVSVQSSAEQDINKYEVKAPLVGTFYRAASPDDEPFVVVGKKVSKGDLIGIIEAMKLMNEIVSPVDGEVVSIDAVDSEMVEYNQVLITIKEQ